MSGLPETCHDVTADVRSWPLAPFLVCAPCSARWAMSLPMNQRLLAVCSELVAPQPSRPLSRRVPGGWPRRLIVRVVERENSGCPGQAFRGPARRTRIARSENFGAVASDWGAGFRASADRRSCIHCQGFKLAVRSGGRLLTLSRPPPEKGGGSSHAMLEGCTVTHEPVSDAV